MTTFTSRSTASPVPASAPAATESLTPREREVIALMALGSSNAAICRALFISPKTLETHVQRVFSKLNLRPGPEVHRRVCAVLAWMEATTVTDVAEASGSARMWDR